ncbi:MAG: transglutaminase domain-containing protein [Candidatus Bathyarchaeota archaeon]|nr:MAG: transglutaminase domain-containing protein [Candidatus Bathyarchaeota archaeon]
MKGYQKLAVFLAVLLFSVSLMSVAIDILGDITDLELDVDTQLTESATAGSEATDVDRGKGQAMSAHGLPGGTGPLFEINYPPMIRYLRWFVGETYHAGEWELEEGHEWSRYRGQEIEYDLPGDPLTMEHFFTVRPFFNITGFIPGSLYTTKISGLEALEHYSYLELFSTPESFSRTYGVSHLVYDPLKAVLRHAEVTIDENYLQVPEELTRRLEGLAEGIVDDASSPWEQLKAIEYYIKDNFEYDEEYEPAQNETDPVEWFLFRERKGVCTQFNSAFILLSRSAGIPTRAVTGFLVKPDSDYQIVIPRDAHFWAEAHFEGLGWVTFDATPEREEEAPVEIRTWPTVTDITYNDPVALKGGSFQVHGTVTLFNGTPIDGLTVEVFLTLKKNETDAPCGTGIVRDGFFNITCGASPDIAVGDYNLVAHTLPSGVYQESWSDPPIRIMAETELAIQAPASAYVGRSLVISGVLTENASGEPVVNTTLTIQLGSETRYLKTDGEGRISMTHTFEEEGNETVSVIMKGDDYYLGSNSSIGIAVALPPAPRAGILQIITTFPYNVMVAAGIAVIVGGVLLSRKKEKPVSLGREPLPEDYDDELPLTFKDYKEGVVKLFNRFYGRSRRRYEGIDDSMTPREFQAALLGKMPEKGAPALEYLVTAFEIADYSTSTPTKEVYEKCFAAVELLSGLMENE